MSDMKIALFIAILMVAPIPASGVESGTGNQPQKKAVVKPATPGKKTIMVFNLVPERGVDIGFTNILTEVVINEVSKLNRFTVLGQKHVDKMMVWEKEKQLKGCTDTECLVQIAGAIGAAFYVEGSIGTVGDSYVVTLKLIDAMEARVLERDTVKVEKNENKAMSAVESLVSRIMRKDTVPLSPPAASTMAPVATASKETAKPMPLYTKLGMGLTFSGIGVAGIGGVMTGLAYSANSDYKNGGSAQQMKDADDRRNLYNALAVTGYCLGGAMVVTGVVLWVLGEQKQTSPEKSTKVSSLTVTPVITGDLQMLSVGGGW
jgi:TolB-like protein